jgi:hypothetical protein
MTMSVTMTKPFMGSCKLRHAEFIENLSCFTMLSFSPKFMGFAKELKVGLGRYDVSERCIYHRLAKGHKVTSLNRFVHSLTRRSSSFAYGSQGSLVYPCLDKDVPRLLHLTFGTQTARLFKGRDLLSTQPSPRKSFGTHIRLSAASGYCESSNRDKERF